jgi:hypothetical protein
MLCRCMECLLIVVGVACVVAAIFPVFAILPLSEGLQTGLVAAKFLMLPVGAFCLAGAAVLSAKAARK